MFDKFAELKAISSGKATSKHPTYWNHEIDKPLIGTIKEFSTFQHDRFGQQDTVIVELESGELVSAILTPYLSSGMRMQNASVNDLVLIQLLGKDRINNGNTFNKFNLVVRKA
ncbi:MAG: hypothetical protein ACOYL3_28890 [Desulfuromonadaceae bacterium]